MSKPYLAVIAASKGYMPGLAAFLNSFRVHHKGMGIKIIACDYDLTDEFREKYAGDDLEYVKVSSHLGNIWATKIERFRVATEQTGCVVGVFDADMFCCGSMLNFWRIAEAGMVVGGSNGSNIQFGSNWDESYKMEVPNVWDYKTITSVPTFMDIDTHGEVWRSLYEHKVETNAGADFNLVNIFLMKLNKMEYIVTIPSEQVTGVHHFQIKPDTRVILKGGKLLTNNGLELLCVHGRYWEGNWYENLMKPIPKHVARLGVRNRKSLAYQGALQSREILKQEFDKYCDWPYVMDTKEATLANVKEQEDLFFTEAPSLEEENALLSELNMDRADRNEKLYNRVNELEAEVARLKGQQQELPL
jgi:hypothetical protein